MPVIVRPKFAAPLASPIAVALLLSLLVAWRAPAQTGSLFFDGGNVGIGVAEPAVPLHVGDDTGSNGLAEVILLLENNGPPRFDLTDTNNDATYRQAVGRVGTESYFRLLDTDDPAQVEFELRGDGDLIITGSLTTAASTYPDYVFEDSYELMPLADLAIFIEQNGHLPNVPSAEETDGGRKVNMTDLQIRLLEKVEELTLYTLQQEERIEQLKRRSAEQVRHVERLLARVEQLEDR
jgi:hypothetical protein